MAISTTARTLSQGTGMRTRPTPYAPAAPMSGYQTQQQQAVRAGSRQPPSMLTQMPTQQQRPAMGGAPQASQFGYNPNRPAMPGGQPIGPVRTGVPETTPRPPYPQPPGPTPGTSPPRPQQQQTRYIPPPPSAPPGGWPQATPPGQPTYPGAPQGQAYAPGQAPPAYQSRSDELIYPGMQRRDLPYASWELNEDQRMQAEMDRIRGYEELARGRNAIGSDPAAEAARNLALDRAISGGLFDDPYLDQQRGLIRNRGSIAMEGARRGMNEDLARRGLEGGVSAYQLAQLDQQGALGIQQQLGDFEQQARGAQAEEQRAALDQLLGITGREEAARSAMDQAIANVFLETERAPFDVSELTQPTRKGKRSVAYREQGPKPKRPK